jgi:hypothetical protein
MHVDDAMILADLVDDPLQLADHAGSPVMDAYPER